MKNFNIVRFYEEIIHEIKRGMSDSDLILFYDQVNYSYKIAKETITLCNNIKLDEIPKNMDRYLFLIDDYYKLNKEGVHLAIICSLFHNIGYLIQIKKYHKICDNIKDNQELGLFYLMETKVLRDLSVEEQIVVYEVVHNHSRMVPNCIDECAQFYVELIKEAKLNYNNGIKKKL